MRFNMSEMRELYETDLDFEAAVNNATNRHATEIINMLHRLRKYGQFQEGDILIKEENVGYRNKNGEYKREWRVEKFSRVNSAPRKYKVIYVNEVGAPYISKISMKGDLCGDIKCMYGYSTDHHRFKHDPDFLDHQILAEEDEKFDPQEVYKEKRSEYFKTKSRKAEQA